MTSRTFRLAASLAVMFALGAAAVRASAEGTHTGALWPVALATGALLLGERAWARRLLASITVLAAATFLLGGYPTGVAVGYGVGIALEAWVTHQVVSRRWRRSMQLYDTADLGRYAAGCVLGAAAGALTFMTTSALASFGTPWKVGLAVLVTHLVGQTLVLGIFQEREDERPLFTGGHRLIAWTSTVVFTVVAFIPDQAPSLAFLVIPSLGWMAFNGRMRESTLQLLVVCVVAGAFTNHGSGPFSDEYLLGRLDVELWNLPLQAFFLACALVSIPLSLTVGMQRRTSAQALLERGRSELMMRSAHGVAIMGTDENGCLSLFNPGAERILGYSAEEVLGRNTSIFHTDDEIARMSADLGVEPSYSALVDTMHDRPTSPARDIEFIRKDGVARILSTIISPIRDEQGAMVGYVATADDVTDRIETTHALETALESEKEAVERLTEVDQIKDRFVSSVSHELRTPITNIVGYLELLNDGIYGDLTDDQARAMSRVDTNSRRLLTLIDDLLTLSSVESLDRPREHAPVDLVAVLRRAEEIVRPSLLRRDLGLEVDVPDRQVVIAGDGGQLERLVINLATNAVKFTLDGGRVSMRLLAASNGTGPVIEVEDTGIGIPANDQDMLFNRFFRAAQARETAVPGSGLGLSIAKAITEGHGGRISATSVPGEGSTFRVEFPPPVTVPQR